MSSESPTASTPPAAKPTFTQPIVALPDRKFFIKRMVIAAVVVGFAAFFLYDGFVRYPNHNRKVEAVEAKRKALDASASVDQTAPIDKELRDLGNKKSDFDILLQRLIGFALTPVGLFLLFKFLRESRGELKLDGDVIYVPGHPPVPIPSITAVNNVRWEKKGIAIFDYRLADGTSGRFKIDDFVFVRPPTDAIHDEILEKMPKAKEL
jgi:hypothetical protein